MATLASTPRTNRLTAATATVGPFPLEFRLFDSDGLTVYLDGVASLAWTLSASFGNGFADDAAINFLSPVSAGSVIQIDGALIPDRELDYLNGDPNLSEKLNVELARLWSAIAEAKMIAGRSLRSLDAIDAVADFDVDSIADFTASAGQSAIASAISAASSAASAADALSKENSMLRWLGQWVTGASYQPSDIFYQDGSSYMTLVAHVSGVFSNDLASSRMQLFALKGAAGLGTGDLLVANKLGEFASVLPDVHANLSLRPGVDVQVHSARLSALASMPLVQGDTVTFDGAGIVPFAKGPPRTVLRMDNDGGEQVWGDIEPLIGSWTYSANVTDILFPNLAGWDEVVVVGDIAFTGELAIRLSADNGITLLLTGYSSFHKDQGIESTRPDKFMMARSIPTILNFRALFSNFATPRKTYFEARGRSTNFNYIEAVGNHQVDQVNNSFRIEALNLTGGSIRVYGRRAVSGISQAVNTLAPVISTTGKIGALQAASVATFTGAVSIERRWTVAGLVVATTAGYTPTAADDGKNLVRQSRGIDSNGIPSVWVSSAPVVITYVVPVVSLQPTIVPTSAVAGSIFNLTNGAATPNASPTVEYFRLGVVLKSTELNELAWDSTGEPLGVITFRMRYTNSGGFVLSDEITATLTAAAAAPSPYTVGMWGLSNVPSAGGDKLSINIISNPANNGSAQTAIYWKNGAGALQLLSGGATLGSREITVPATTLASIKLFAANAIGTAIVDSDIKTATPTVGADTIPPAISGLSIAGNVFSFTLSEPATNYLLINNSATPLGGTSEAAADAIKALVIGGTPLVEDTFSAALGVNNRTLNLTPLSNGTWYIHEAAFDAALNRSAASPYGFTYVAPGAGGNVAFASATQMLLTSAANTIFNSTADHTVGSGANKCVIVTIKGLSAVVGVPVISPITFGGVAMTEVIAPVGSTGKEWIAVYRIMAPSSGAKALAFTCSTNQNAMEAYAEEYTDVNQATPIPYSASFSTGGSFVTTLATPRTTIANGAMVIGALVLENGAYAADIDNDSASIVVSAQTGILANSDISVGNSRLAMPAIGAGGHAWTWVTVDRGTAILLELAAA